MADPQFRKMDLGESVSIELPALVWLVFLFGYSESDWNNFGAGKIAYAVQEAMFDPIYLREQAAQAQQQLDAHNAAFHGLFLGQQPEMPPNVTDWHPSVDPEKPSDE
jgi:hypothetical protein